MVDKTNASDAASGPAASSGELLQLLLGAAQNYLDQGQLDQAHGCVSQALGLAQEDQLPLRIQALSLLGRIHATRGEDEEALTQWKDCLQLQERAKDFLGGAAILCKMGETLQRLDRIDEARDALQESLRYSAASPPGEERARALEELGTIQRVIGDLEASLHSLSEALRIREAQDDQAGLARTLNRLGNAYLRLGHLPEALEHLRRALQIRESLGDRAQVAATLNNLAVVFRKQGDEEQARLRYRKALEIFKELGEHHRVADVSTNLGMIAFDEGNLAEAESFHRDSLRIYKELRDATGQASCVTNLARLSYASGRYAEAEELSRQAVQILVDAKKLENRDKTQYILFVSLLAMDKLADAERVAEEVERMGQQSSSWEILSEASLLRSHYAYRKGDMNKALEEARKGEELARKVGHMILVGEALRLQGSVHLRQANFEQAQESLLAAERSHKRPGAPDLLALCRLTLGRLFVKVGAREAGAQRLRQAGEMFRKLQNRALCWRAALSLAEVEWPLSRKQARATLQGALELAQELERPELIQRTQSMRERLESSAFMAADSASQLAVLMELRDALRGIQDPVSVLDAAIRFLVEHLELKLGFGELGDIGGQRAGPHPRGAKIREETGELLAKTRQALHGQYSWMHRESDGRAEFLAAFPITGLGPSLLGFLVLGGEDARGDATRDQDPPGCWTALEAAAGIIGLALEIVGCEIPDETYVYASQEETSFEKIVGSSPPMREIFQTISQLAPSDATVLILGESGTGKELVARAIHNRSKRATRPFIAISCPSIPRELIEAELFGHEKGAYTGAHTARPGRIEQADGGTLFLDEIGDMDQATQTKLLRFLQEREFQRVGGRSSIRVDVRILAATSRDLEEEVEAERFRSDLYYRLSVVPLRLPPLSARKEDIPLLVQHCLETFAKSEGKETPHMTRDAMEILRRYPWPGNVRELRNTMEYLVAMTATKTVRSSDLPPKIRDGAGAAPETVTVDNHDIEGSPLNVGETLDARLMSVEGKLIRQALDACEGNQSRAAKMLGLKEGTLRYRMKRYGISAER